MHTRLRKGFSLIELLIVITIIGVLGTMSVFTYNRVKENARDTRRIADIQQIQKALTLYYNEHGVFPGQSGSVPCGFGWFDSSAFDEGETGFYFLEALIAVGIMNPVPLDPLNNIEGGCPEHAYFYNTYSAGTKDCDETLGDYYILAIKSFERITGVHPDGPHFNCPGFNWELEYDFAWVTGGFAGLQ